MKKGIFALLVASTFSAGPAAAQELETAFAALSAQVSRPAPTRAARPAQPEIEHLGASGFIDVTKVDNSALGIFIDYPGSALSGLCGVELRFSEIGFRASEVQDFVDALDMTVEGEPAKPPKIVDDRVLFSLVDPKDQEQRYGIMLTLATKSGETLPHLARRMFQTGLEGPVGVIALATKCAQ